MVLPEGTSEVRLIITGENQSALESIDAVGKAVTGISEAIAQMGTRFAEAGTSIAEFGRGVGEAASSLSRVSGSLTRFGKKIGEQATAVTEATDKIVTDLQRIPTVADEVAQNASQSMRELAASEREVSSASYVMTDRINAEANAIRASAELIDANTKATRQNRHDQMLGVIAMQMIGYGITRVGMLGAKMFIGAIKSAMDFQASMDRVGAALKTTGGDTASNLNNLGNLAKNLSETSLYSANDIADAMQALAKQGLSYQDIYKGAASATITLAQATDSSLTDTGTVVTDTMHEFGLTGSQLTPVINAISGAMHQANIKMTDFYNSMKYAGPVASKLGMSVTDVSTAIGLLAQHGIKGSQAGTTLRRMFLQLQPHTKAAIAEFKSLNLLTANGTSLFYDASGKVKSMGDVISILRTHLSGLNPVQRQQALNTMFGTYALSGMTVMAGETAQQWAALQKSMSNTSAAEVAAQKMNNLKGHLKEFTSTLQTIGMDMAQFLIPAIDKAVLFLDKLATKFQNMSPWMQHAIFIILGVGSALAILVGTLITVRATMMFMSDGWEMIGKELLGAKTKIISFATETVPEFIASLLTIKSTEEGVAAEGTLVTFFGSIGNALKAVTVTPMLKSFALLQMAMKAETWTSLGNGFVGAFKTFTEVSKTAVKTMVDTSILKLTAMKTFLSGLTIEKVATGFVGGLTSMGTGVLSFGKALGSFMLGPWGLLIAAITAGVVLIVTHWSQIMTWVKTNFGTSLPQIVSHLKQDLSAAFTFMKNIVVEVWNAIENVTRQVWAYIGPTIIGAIQTVEKWWKSIWPELSQVLKVVFGVMAIYIGTILFPLFLAVKAALGALESSWKQIWGTIVSALKLVWDTVVGIIRLGWDIISGIIKVGLDILTGRWGKAWGDVKTLFSNIWNDIFSLMKGFVTDAYNFGKNFVQMIAKGIEGAASSVWNAVKGVAGHLTHWLGFHSPSAGLPDSDQWATNFVNMFAQGLADGQGTVGNAVAQLSSPLSSLGDTSGTSSGMSGLDSLSPDQITTKISAVTTQLASAQAIYQKAIKSGSTYAIIDAADKVKLYKNQLTQLQNQSLSVTSGIGTNFTDMTSGVTTDFTGLTNTTSTDMSQWNTMFDSTSANIGDSFGTMSTGIGNSMADITTESSKSAIQMQNAMTVAFTNITMSAKTMATEIMQAASQIKWALSTIGVSGSNVNVSGSSTSNIALQMLGGATSMSSSALGRGSKSVTINGGIHVNSNAKDANSVASAIKTQLGYALR